MQGPPPSLIKYKPFLVSFILGIVLLVIYIILIVLATSCGITDLTCFNRSDGRYISCYSGYDFYCCSSSSSYGPYSCFVYTDCQYNGSNVSNCSGLYTGSWVVGSLATLCLFLMIVFACQYRSQRRALLMQAAYQNIAQNPVYYTNQQGNYVQQQQQSQNPIVYSGNDPLNQQRNYNPPYGQPNNQN